MTAPWLRSAADLLQEPDPGPTPFLIEELIVDQAIATLVGAPKVGKTWSALEIAIAVVTGRKAWGRYGVPEPGPVVLVVEESGSAALGRRLGKLVRGNALDPDALADLHYAANLGVRLNDKDWQERLLEVGQELRPRAFLLDPLVRLKGSTVDENSQREIGPVLDFMRDLRKTSGAAVVYTHHTGHNGGRQRGSSDLEGYWESRIVLTEDAGVRTITADHREAESGHAFQFLLDFDMETDSLRLRALVSELERRVEDYLRQHPTASANDVHAAVGGNRATVLKLVADLRKTGGTAPPVPPGTTVSDLPSAGGTGEGALPRRGSPPGTAPPVGGTGARVPTSENGRPLIGDPGYLDHVFRAFEARQVTEQEWHRAERAHRFVASVGAAQSEAT